MAVNFQDYQVPWFGVFNALVNGCQTFANDAEAKHQSNVSRLDTLESSVSSGNDAFKISLDTQAAKGNYATDMVSWMAAAELYMVNNALADQAMLTYNYTAATSNRVRPGSTVVYATSKARLDAMERKIDYIQEVLVGLNIPIMKDDFTVA